MFGWDLLRLLESHGVEIVFRHQGRIWLSLIIPALWILAIWVSVLRRREMKNPWIKIHLPVSKLPSLRKRTCWWFFLGLGMLLAVVAFMVPEQVHEDSDRVFDGVRLTIIFDSSISMPRAEDVKPNRMVAAKELVRWLVEMLARDHELKGRYPLALIPFAGSAQPFFVPFTVSREEFLAALDEIDENTLTTQGTSLWAAIKSYEELLFWYQPREDTVDIAVLISDGGKEEGRGGEREMLPEIFRVLDSLVKFGRGPGLGAQKEKTVPAIPWSTVLHTIGVGVVEIDAEGRRIVKPAELVTRDKAGNFMGLYRENPQNPHSRVLKSALDEENLRFVAKLGGGEYLHFSQRKEIAGLLKKSILPHRKIAGAVSSPKYESIFGWFLGPAFIIFYFLFGYGGWLLRVLRLTLLVKQAFIRR